ncbi:iron ABC transporter permease [Williamsia sp. CHRR-6]|uniref:FecCD family ABC transporter permease n=1 Tax=Williamsia sp. CHRR-6 TaxID=2835871 RepID=UPI001BDA5F5F|nr:iron ABC transporter permease [Williamsia sp. CHRR-6]MBT0567310.1 iron ABC transporter permease [Williamsia sp. CHRR-6]
MTGLADRAAGVSRRGWLGVAVMAAPAALIAALCIGTLGLNPLSVVVTLIDQIPGVDVPGGLTGVDARIVTELRLPRVLMAAVVGATLAVAGGAYQGVFRNPLADPYLLGAAAGAGLGATLVIAYAPVRSVGPVGVVALAAFVGALAGVAMAYVLGAAAARAGGSEAVLVLAGIAVASFLSAAQTLVQQSDSEDLRQIYSWILGGLGGARWSDLWLMVPYAAVSVVVLIGAGRALDVLAVGDDEATTLGIRPARVRLIILAAASLGTAAAVSVSGLIGFVGLVVPHVVRRLVGPSYRLILPVSVLVGATFLMMADMVARTVLAPAEIPIGVVTAFVGAPFFAALLRRRGAAT